MAETTTPETASNLKIVIFLVISDTHNLQLTNDQSLLFRPLGPEVDVVLHYRDLTFYGSLNTLNDAIEMIGSIKAELRLVIAGNYDMSLDKDCWHREDGTEEGHREAVETITGEFVRNHGVTYLAEGSHRFQLSKGVKSSVYASTDTPY